MCPCQQGCILMSREVSAGCVSVCFSANPEKERVVSSWQKAEAHCRQGRVDRERERERDREREKRQRESDRARERKRETERTSSTEKKTEDRLWLQPHTLHISKPSIVSSLPFTATAVACARGTWPPLQGDTQHRSKASIFPMASSSKQACLVPLQDLARGD